MLPDRVDEMLRNYREYLGRVLHLERYIVELKQEIEKNKAEALVEAASPGSPNMDGMPHGTIVSQPTERIALQFASGNWPEFVQESMAKLKEAEDEYNEKVGTVIFVDAWLKGLTERERWIIEKQVIDKAPWREVTAMFYREFDSVRSKEGLKYIRDKALQKIYKMAE